MSQFIFLAKFTLVTSFYMQDNVSKSECIRLICADSIQDATDKLLKHYRATIDFEYDYHSSNSIENLEITEPII